MAIPKIIHYCWFGDNPLPPIEQDCLATWKNRLDDYDYMFWNEQNTILNVPFVKFAYENKKWAYVSDYIRLKCLYDYGGVYLDTDMYVIRDFDSLLKESCFFGAESATRISCGIIGAEKNNPFIKKCLEYYENLEGFDISHFTIPITKIITQIFRKHSYFEGDFLNVLQMEGVKIFSPDYFYPVPYNEFRIALDKEFETYAKEDTYAIHLWSGSWQNLSEFALIANRKYFKGILALLKNVDGRKVFRKKYLKKIYKAYKLSKLQ